MIIFILFLIVSAVLFGGWLGFRYGFSRQSEPDWEDQESLNASPMWRNHPVSIPAAAQWLRNHNAQDISTESFDGLPLRGKWVPAEHPRATIILVHGYRSHYLTDFGGIFQRYHDLGLNLLLIRHRAHGESGGKYITFGVHERKDVLRWIQYHNEHFGSGDLFLGGMSMGAATVQYVAGEALPDNVRGITADCGFTSPADIIARVIQKDFHLPPKLVLPLLNLFTRTLAGFSLWECDTRKTGKLAKTPILMLHGKADDFVPCSMTEESFAVYAGPKELITVEGAGHGMSYMTDPIRCRTALTAFFDRNITSKEKSL